MARVAVDFAALLDAVLEGFQVIGPDWRYLHLNEAAARHGRTSPEALLGRTMMECYPGIEDTELFSILRRCLAEQSSQILENVFTFPDGAVGYFELRIEPVPQGLCVLSIDVTARRQAELAKEQAEGRLRHAERMEAVGQLAAGIAHDFNNLLAVIIAQAEFGLGRPEGPTREDLESILVAARSSAELTRQILAYGRRSHLEREVVDVSEALRGVEQLLRRSLDSRIELRLEAGAGVGRVEADRSQLEQIVLNLVVNARDAIPGTGRITVEAVSADLDEEYVRSQPGSRRGPHTVLVVSDTGVGMDASTMARIFEPYFTTKERGRGTGLGLATVYGIVKQHGGSIWAYSEPGKGTTFKVYLPVTDRPLAPAAPRVARPAAAVGGKGTVLVAEDGAVLRKLMAATLAGGGFQVLLAANGAEALALWEKNEPSIALLVTDVMMPGMAGPELIHRIRARRPGLPVVCTSGYTGSHLAERIELPADVVFVEKPFSPKVLLERVQALLGGAS